MLSACDPLTVVCSSLVLIIIFQVSSVGRQALPEYILIKTGVNRSRAPENKGNLIATKVPAACFGSRVECNI